MDINLFIISVILVLFGGILFTLNRMAAKYIKFPHRVFAGLGLGVLFGLLLQLPLFGEHKDAINTSFEWINIIGSGYMTLLRMIIMPLVIVSISGAILGMDGKEDVGKTTGQILLVLIGTTAISAIIGITVSLLFNLQAPDIITDATINRGATLEQMAATTEKSLPKQILDMLPSNPFLDMTGVRSTSTIAVVIFTAFFALAARQIAKKKESSFNRIKELNDAFHDVIMRMLTIILRLTPYAVAAMIGKMIATSSWGDIYKLLIFILASYIGLLTIFLVHLILLSTNGLNPIHYIRKSWPVFLFGFSSRSSAGTIPLNIKAQTEALGVSESSANLSATLGATIGQNGCAGLYPAMVAVMILATSGGDMGLAVMVKLVLAIAISSFGVAGVGGGATFAALIVLGIMNLPVALVGLLISIEPLIDMGRTAINISGSMTAGVLSSRWQKTLDMDKYNDASIAISSDD
ncbi:cation:dicarboxylase symporter family transporter [Entomospira entomophila]|uniref:Cation:dicarboxylase symporter family transporter n=1 Tax=Entomospira entomophila TaxID=2719988 RepID=A0A968KSW0_9SPIO|nr:cation:dicarboxylase symporter family transporter [Entomospira entomophilus]NIZ40772.1 cation:dicarboxylase symporter family transporter [Entomospira entomophilus]WDI34985.1 cation:dicarboxylase symporter family transporter [Entomospira entomophilus]